MKAKDIEVGGVYATKVSGARVAVRVIDDTGARGRRYRVVRVDNGLLLDKLRSAMALHPSVSGYWPGMAEKQD